MNPFSCKICGSPECQQYAVKSDISSREASVRIWHYVKCSKCGVISLYPLPDIETLKLANETLYDLKRPESSFNLHFKPEYRQTYFAETELTFRDLKYDPHIQPGILLDVGCANGQFLDFMKEHGWHTTGCDVSRQLTALADHSAHEIHCEDFFRVHFAPQSFDMVSFLDTIEHVLDPVAFISRIASLLKPGGLLFLQTPCQGVLSEAYGENWRRLLPPDHIHLFNFPTLTSILNGHNLAIRTWVRWGGGSSMGHVPDTAKKAWDRIAKELGIGDEISLLAVKV